MVSKCRRIAEVVAVMEMAQVGVTPRARASLAMGGAAAATASAERKPKRRRINNKELKFSASSSLVQLKGRSRPDVIQSEADQRCSSAFSDELPSSCCSSNGSNELDEERIELVNLEVDSAQVETSTCNCGDERKMSPSNELRGPNSEEVNKPTAEANTRCISTVQKMPTKLELEVFFAAAENDIQKRFAEKYCYDIVKDVPLLEGRYEWVQIKP